MFGTIGHGRLKPGNEAQMQTLMDDWKANIRPKIPGGFLNTAGFKAGMPNEMVFMALAQDESTYRGLANMPEQDAWFRKLSEMIDGDVTWEDVQMDVFESVPPTA
ncbi:MAG: hypothetical protein ACJ789_16120 [Thermomicrobiales bacterium]